MLHEFKRQQVLAKSVISDNTALEDISICAIALRPDSSQDVPNCSSRATRYVYHVYTILILCHKH